MGGFVSSANSNFAHWGALLNRMSGYEEIHALKQTVVENGTCPSSNIQQILMASL